MAVATSIAVGAVAAGTVASSIANKRAADKAADAQKDALRQVQGVNVEEASKAALEADRKRFEEQFKLQREIDPTVAALRDRSAGRLLSGLTDDPRANAVLDALASEALSEGPTRERLIDSLIEGAEAELDAGATLPPEFQAELVRAGLERTGQAGLSPDYRAAAGAHTRQLLGQAGLELQAHRRDQATRLLDTAENLRQGRAQILSGVLGDLENTQNARQQRQLNTFTAGSAAVPSAGLSGADVTNLQLANQDIQNQKAIGAGNIKANQALSQGQFISGLINAGTGVASGGLNLYSQAQIQGNRNANRRLGV